MSSQVYYHVVSYLAQPMSRYPDAGAATDAGNQQEDDGGAQGVLRVLGEGTAEAQYCEGRARNEEEYFCIGVGKLVKPPHGHSDRILNPDLRDKVQ
uniref:Uncharacterized protein n=1 Tax=Timema monikensis TaxID=170555 RepID=A0A7R9HND9_9NEOP|nr:unnamed protein product [Timema monikensis]